MTKHLLKYFTLWTIISISILLSGVKAGDKQENVDEIICMSVTVRSIQDLENMKNCTVIAGHVHIVEVSFTDEQLKDMASQVAEISEYLLVYHVNGLTSLSKIFPNLVFIRGVELLYDEFALVIVENPDLEMIGLFFLEAILKGSIRIESNPVMCYVNTINWVPIMGKNRKDYHVYYNNNKAPNECPSCYIFEEGNRFFHRGCWARTAVQFQYSDHIGTERCIGSNCLTSCFDAYCKHCATFMSDKGCMQFCSPALYRLAHKRKCVTDCGEYDLLEVGIECVEECPKNYDEINTGNNATCALNCAKDFVIHNIKDLEGMADCTTIDGSLTIEIHEMHKNIVPHLQDAFRDLNEITGYLKILHSPQIVSLHFFENLHTIRGLKLVENRFSVYVVNNKYLQELFYTNVAINYGCIYVHLNARLCFDKIESLSSGLKRCHIFTPTDVSRYSNGEQVACGEHIVNTNVTIVDYNSTAALIEVNLLSYNDLYTLIGYVYYYREAPFKNLTKYEGRHGCGKDEWFTDIVPQKLNHHIITGLKPGTQYGVFVNSLTALHYSHTEFISEIHYFTTRPAKPGPVANLFFATRSDTDLDLHWWPPIITNGKVEKYILHYRQIGDKEVVKPIVPNREEQCECGKHHTESHIPTPHGYDYFDQELYYYKDNLQNFMFKKRKKIDKNNTFSVEQNAILQARVDAIYARFEQEAAQKQEKDRAKFIIVHPKPICPDNVHVSNQQQLAEINCQPLEKYNVTVEIEGFRHSVLINNLSPHQTYRFSLRACVKGLENGCGPEKVIMGYTVSEKILSVMDKTNHT